MAKYYQPSGKFEPLALVFLALASLTAIPLLSFIFALSGIEISYLVLKLLFPLLFAALVGSCINCAIIIFGKTRNGLVGFILASIATIWAYYLHWIFYFVYVSYANTDTNLDFSYYINHEGSAFYQEFFYLLKNPTVLWLVFKKYLASGTWSFFGISFNGGLLLFVLIVEFLAIYLLSVFIGFVNYDKPFDEVEKKWFKSDTFQIDKYYFPEDNIVSRLEQADYKDFFTVDLEKLRRNDAGTYYSVHTLYHSGSKNYLTIENIIDKIVNNKPKKQIKGVVKYIEITPQLADDIKKNNISKTSPES